ncbi:ABC-2 type transport system permease protein [Algoriella xinjiangensis]|uniref:ABC-2 type transport system permease protein n=1 Tax=Algoriella xinjiangensis TaxID=684065 RepID=A0A1I4VNE5_9FLAO|nr:ABC transporter permease subunit [Algoriella xinjiangensis]SFN02808.1 ABC-2 type transport system permease protein [Algoriella xinjiangensis]VDH17264.1 ABC-type transport system involved in multi-copper enzyme maturation, permease component [Algoriella xinjiangensis]
MWTIFKKEFSSFYLGFTAYLAAATFVIVSALFLWFFDNEFNVFNTGNASLSSFFFIGPWILLFMIPALTMKLIAEEQANGTLLWLFTLPIKNSQIIWGKYLAVVAVVVFCLLSTFLFTITLQEFLMPEQELDYGTIFSGYLGLFFLGCLFAAIGLFTSSITKNQVMAYVLAVFFCFIIYYGFEGLASYNLLGSADFYVQKIGSYTHYNQFLKGILDTRDLLYFIVLIAILNQFTIVNLENKK